MQLPAVGSCTRCFGRQGRGGSPSSAPQTEALAGSGGAGHACGPQAMPPATSAPAGLRPCLRPLPQALPSTMRSLMRFTNSPCSASSSARETCMVPLGQLG